MIFSKLQNLIAQNKSFLLSSHVNSDGDSIGSTLALYWYLASLHKDVAIYHIDKVPNKFRFLRNIEKISSTLPQTSYDIFIILDASNPARLGWDINNITFSSLINIDHHRDNFNGGDLNLVNHEAAATCQILYMFFQNLSIPYPEYVAESLYTGILSDTGGFHFSNTTSNILRICADLADQGADCTNIYRSIYSSFSSAGLMLRAKIWAGLEFHFNNRVSIMALSTEEFENSGADRGDIEGMSDQALTAEEAEIGIFIKHNPTCTHFSLRSKGNIDVGKIAQTIPGGGGHTCAAGCTLNLPITKAKPKMLEIIKKEIT